MVNHSISARLVAGKCLACGRPRVSHGTGDPEDPLGCGDLFPANRQISGMSLRRPPVHRAARYSNERLPPEGVAHGSRNS
jgi:hypothetical protein